MKLIIAGSRTIYFGPKTLNEIINSLIDYEIIIDEVVSGKARGMDAAGEHWAKENNVKVTIMEPDWNNHGKAAGPIRNEKMAKYADALLLVWDGKSRGSANMRKNMKKLDKPIYEVILKAPCPE